LRHYFFASAACPKSLWHGEQPLGRGAFWAHKLSQATYQLVTSLILFCGLQQEQQQGVPIELRHKFCMERAVERSDCFAAQQRETLWRRHEFKGSGEEFNY